MAKIKLTDGTILTISNIAMKNGVLNITTKATELEEQNALL